MKWFKHHTDNHRGRSIQDLMDQMGHVGLSYYIILEMCAEKLQKNKDETVTEVDCLFRFSQRIVRHSCRISQTNLRRLLDICQTNGLLSWKDAGNEIEISMPILLDLLEKNLKKRTIRGLRVSSKHPLDKDKDIDKDKEEEKNKERRASSPDFSSLVENLYINHYPKKEAKQSGINAFKKIIKNQDDLGLLEKAILNYAKKCSLENIEYKFIRGFGSFASKDFWRDFVEWVPRADVQSQQVKKVTL